MVKLAVVVETGSLTGRRFELENGALVLGREEGCAVRFNAAGDPHVSRRHAVIRRDGPGYILTDLGSTNGTLVNGRRVASAWLAAGDRLQLGPQGPRLRLQITAEAGPVDPPRPSGMPSGAAFVPPHREATAAPLGPPALSRPSVTDFTLYNPILDKGRPSGSGMGLLLAMLATGAFMALVMLLVMSVQLGCAGAMVGIMTAFLPAPFYLAIWLWLDRYDPEPAWALAGALAWGAGVATLAAYIINTLVGVMAQAVTGNPAAADFLSASFSAPLVEEAGKGLPVVLIMIFLRREFDGVLDGIVYAGVVALGFATIENVIYYGQGFAHGGGSSLLATFLVRGLLGPFTHSVYTSMTGIGCGIARQTHQRALRWLAPIMGYGAAVLLHFLWNTLAGMWGSLGFLLSYLLVWGPLFLTFFASVIWIGHREARLIGRALVLEVPRGLLTAEQAARAGSWFRRVAWLVSALGDPGRLAARRRFLHAATRLALCYWHVDRADAAGSQTISLGQIPLFRRELEELRDRV